MFRLQLQFFSRCCVGISCCNAAPFLYRICCFQTIVCNNFVPNGTFPGTAIHGPMPVQRETLEELSGPLVRTNFPRKRHAPVIGPYKFSTPEIRMDQWRSKFSESFSLDRHWSIRALFPTFVHMFGLACGGRVSKTIPQELPGLGDVLSAPKSQRFLQLRLGIPVSPYRIQNPPRPENPRKLLKNYNLAHPGPVPKITEKITRKRNFLVIY